MKKLLLTLALALGLCSAAPAIAQEPAANEGIQFLDNAPWAEVVERATKENKLIFIDCYTVWCGPCKGLARDIFPQKALGDFFNPRFICVKYDMEKGDGKMLHDRYKEHILGFPTMLFIDKDGKVVQQLAGYQEADVIINAAKKVASGKDLFTLKKQYAEGQRDVPFLKDYIESLNAAFMKDDAAAVAKEFIATMDPKQLEDPDVWSAFGQYVTDVDSPAFEYLAMNAPRLSMKNGMDRYKTNFQLSIATNGALREIFDIDIDKEGNIKPLSTDTVKAERLIGYQKKFDNGTADGSRAKLYIHKALLAGDIADAWSVIKTMRKIDHSAFYPNQINDYVSYMLPLTKDKKVLKEYLAVLEPAIDNSKSKSMAYDLYKTIADIQTRLGNKKEAARRMEQFKVAEEENMAMFRKMFGVDKDDNEAKKEETK